VNPGAAAAALDYSQAPILAPLDAGVRPIELDVSGDAKGGLFALPAYLRMGGEAPMPSGWLEAMDTFDGPSQVRWEEDAGVSLYGPLTYLVEFRR
jgi:hypothetical protein